MRSEALAPQFAQIGGQVSVLGRTAKFDLKGIRRQRLFCAALQPGFLAGRAV
jgi:hypothetical protein